MTYTSILAVALGSALGGVGRFWCSGIVARHVGEAFPWGTFTVNALGSLAIGLFATVAGPDGRLLVGPTARQFFMLGVCGGFTTFSSFSLQTLNLVQDGEWFQAMGNILVSVTMCMLAVWLGHILGVEFNR